MDNRLKKTFFIIILLLFLLYVYWTWKRQVTDSNAESNSRSAPKQLIYPNLFEKYCRKCSAVNLSISVLHLFAVLKNSCRQLISIEKLSSRFPTTSIIENGDEPFLWWNIFGCKAIVLDESTGRFVENLLCNEKKSCNTVKRRSGNTVKRLDNSVRRLGNSIKGIKKSGNTIKRSGNTARKVGGHMGKKTSAKKAGKSGGRKHGNTGKKMAAKKSSHKNGNTVSNNRRSLTGNQKGRLDVVSNVVNGEIVDGDSKEEDGEQEEGDKNGEKERNNYFKRGNLEKNYGLNIENMKYDNEVDNVDKEDVNSDEEEEEVEQEIDGDDKEENKENTSLAYLVLFSLLVISTGASLLEVFREKKRKVSEDGPDDGSEIAAGCSVGRRMSLVDLTVSRHARKEHQIENILKHSGSSSSTSRSSPPSLLQRRCSFPAVPDSQGHLSLGQGHSLHQGHLSQGHSSTQARPLQQRQQTWSPPSPLVRQAGLRRLSVDYQGDVMGGGVGGVIGGGGGDESPDSRRRVRIIRRH
ncbi:uncharacterized protein LOC111057374 isoform X3 [Nilaparvata lugens]|uniref:uncharacterized protein LOC111057374 isoform X3 n=1 Tax=Nilaparvata lugens TaxID=108931 RepID=UPI00193E1E26|nr:uncharacterized protein LOC111057374 isoform X3 [Nilaparvata lugens]